ncbi:MAG TPA: hypothetical protein VFH97_01535, partial [Gemmatimonadales bacterium]|nr:hypothetical protein [Gemmatimonadales bacterium]
MTRCAARTGLLALLPALLACDLAAPVWTADYLFPIDYPDIELADYTSTGVIPDADLAFSSPLVQQDITGLLEEMLSDELVALSVEVITEATVDVTASLTLTIATSDSLPPPFSASRTGTQSPASSVTFQIGAALEVDTTTVVVDHAALRDAIALYYHTQGTVRGAPGGTPVVAGDRIKVD